MVLMFNAGGPVTIGCKAQTFRGDVVTVVGITPPHRPGSTGRVAVKFEDGGTLEFFPSVIAAAWVERCEAMGR